MNLTLNDRADFVEQNSPALWKLCYPRVYKNAGRYHSPKHVALDLADNLLTVQNLGMAALADNELRRCAGIGAAKLIELRVPIFFVTPDLLTAVQQTAPPLDVDWRTLQLPFHSAAFMLPVGAFKHQTDGDITAIWYTRCMKDESGVYPGTSQPRKTFTNGNDLFVIRLLTSIAQYQQVYSGPEDGILNLVDQDGLRRGDTIHGALAPSTDENALIAAGASILFGLLFVMLARPNLVETGANTGKKTKHGTEFWSPNIIGRNYQIGRQTSESSELGTSPRMHWRRGHWRRQPYGPHQSLRRDQWIEPMLIAADVSLTPAP